MNDSDGTFDSIMSWKLEQLLKSPIRSDMKAKGRRGDDIV